ncbi:hypothetical protein K461DRAFT_221417 [Myriangium duriaei CBS 260.36]|uniref:AAA+ ATPase domain-containing protein n=1 Tax=Myriangium duriaei CBS 260.36 TaxID=1168546 RepID=A0A9P4J579_9PEZI|nr:hypothetical protein K461DRAFT_221417 [Myriangium duriaei CBS 260.36]
MAFATASKGLAITNPLVQYRALLATNRITADPAQYRLAIHLQKLYERLKDYEPTVEYSQRLDQISKAVGESAELAQSQNGGRSNGLERRGVWQSLIEQKERKDSLALTRVLTNHELARTLNSPKGLMLHGEVGTGKSMLIDLFADCLPTRKKRRWHFNTFILEVLATLEQLRKDRLSRTSNGNQEDYSMLWLARDLITKSPILFLDEFQLPDRAASKIMTNLMTSFFQLGGVLIATSNRMPEELHKASGVSYSAPPNRMDSIKWRFGLGGAGGKSKSDSLFAGQGEFAEFLDVLKARCDIWEMESKNDYRRQESGTHAPPAREPTEEAWLLDEHQDLQNLKEDVQKVSDEAEATKNDKADSVISEPTPQAPPHYLIQEEGSNNAIDSLNSALLGLQHRGLLPDPPNWQPALMRVYGRQVPVPRACGGVAHYTFTELCVSTLGPADYLTLTSTFHTLILSDVPILPLLRKNEARRFITLLDALYEARCKLLITAAAGPDDIFFPDQSPSTSSRGSADALHAETLAEAYQDATSPFRPNILSSNPSFSESESTYVPNSEPDYTHARLSGLLAEDALEDDPPNRVLRARERQREREAGPIDPDETRVVARSGPDFAATGAFTGEDERFAYKRARSRLWEMCGAKWWGRTEEGWWRPLPVEVRRWEKSAEEQAAFGAGRVEGEGGDVAIGDSRGITEEKDEVLFRHGASPFRTATEPPPKFSWTHVWGTVKWGKKAGAWGQGVEGLEERRKEKEKEREKKG